MTRDAKVDCNGDLEIMISCPECDFFGTVFYKTHPPVYCCDACKQKAYRKRRIRNRYTVTNMKFELEQMGLSKYQAQFDRIIDTWGVDAARAAAKLAVAVAVEVRDKYIR